MTTSQALLILKSEFKDVFFPDEKGNYKSLCQIEDVFIYILNEMTPEVIKFVEAQKIKEIETVESFYKKKISKHKKIITPKKRKIINTIKN